MRSTWVGATAALAVAVVIAGLAFVVPRAEAPFAAAEQAAHVRSAGTATFRTPAKRTDPRRVVVVGDSVAYTLFPGLRASERRSHLFFLTAAETGCPIDIQATELHMDGQDPVHLTLPAYCQWPKVWPPMIRRTDPDLVVALWGLWDLYDPDVNGTRLVVGTPEWTTFMETTLNHALDILTARGAHVVILTTPYLDMDPGRVDTLNALFRAVAATRPRQVQVLDVQPAMTFLDPQRWDGVHFTESGADVLGRVLVPEIAKANGRSQRG